MTGATDVMSFGTGLEEYVTIPGCSLFNKHTLCVVLDG